MPFQKPSTTTRARSSRLRMLMRVLGSMSEPGGRVEGGEAISDQCSDASVRVPCFVSVLGFSLMCRFFEHRFHPRLIIEIPLHGFADAAFECVSGSPAEFTLDFGGINGVTAIMAGTVFYESDELAGVAAELGREFVYEIGDQ